MIQFFGVLLMFAVLCGTAFASTTYSLVAFEKLPDCSASNLSAKEIAALKFNHIYVGKPVTSWQPSYFICKTLTLASGNRVAISADYESAASSGNDSTTMDEVFNLNLMRPVQQSSLASKIIEFTGSFNQGYVTTAFLISSKGRAIGGVFLGNVQVEIGAKKIRSVYFRRLNFSETGSISGSVKVFPTNPIKESRITDLGSNERREFNCDSLKKGAMQLFHVVAKSCED